MFYYLIDKIFKERRSDVSLLVLARFIILLIFYKLFFKLRRLRTRKKSCLIIFPPSLGLGDLIILSKIVDIIKESNKYELISIYHSAPYLQKKESSISLINQDNLNELQCFEEFILPSPSLLNVLISFIIGKKRCKGYLTNKNHTNLEISNKYSISFEDPYYYRLKPFKEFFEYRKDIKPKVWVPEDRKKLKLNKSYLSINSLTKDIGSFLVISTYNFYFKFRPSFLKILNEIKKYEKRYLIDKILILGANSKKELSYNNLLQKKLEEEFNHLIVLNYSGKLTINNALDLISQSSYYIGANNGLANVAQMLGVNCTLIFNGPENYRKRKFSKFANFIS